MTDVRLKDHIIKLPSSLLKCPQKKIELSMLRSLDSVDVDRQQKNGQNYFISFELTSKAAWFSKSKQESSF